jgi:hypothetical protein
MISEKPKNRFRALLINIFLISAAAHVVALVLFGGYTVYRYVISPGAQFDEPPPAIEEAPPPASVEVAIQRPRATSELPRGELRMQTVGSIAVSSVATDIPSMRESFVVADAGVGGLAGARLGGSASLGLGISDISVFGVRDQGERILFVVDAGRNMVVDAKGGLNSYNAIKEEIIRLTGDLSPGTVFNVLLFESTSSRVERFNSEMLAATPDNINRFRQWFMPINQTANRIGVRTHNVRPANTSDNEVGNTIRSYHAQGSPQVSLTQVMLEQNADLIYVITSEWGGFTRLRRPPNEREAAAIQRENEVISRRRASAEYQRQLQAYNEARQQAARQVHEREVRERADRERRGLPPRIWRSGSLDEKMREYNISIAVEHPDRSLPPRNAPTTFHLEARQIESYFRDYLRDNFRAENRAIPRINLILFLAEDEQVSRSVVDNIRNYLRMFNNGRFRELRGLAAIQASSGGR